MATSRMRAQEYGQGTDLDSSRWGAEASWVDALKKRLGGEGSQAHRDDDERRRGQRRQKVQPERQEGAQESGQQLEAAEGCEASGLLEAGFSVCVSLSGHCSAFFPSRIQGGWAGR